MSLHLIKCNVKNLHTTNWYKWFVHMWLRWNTVHGCTYDDVFKVFAAFKSQALGQHFLKLL